MSNNSKEFNWDSFTRTSTEELFNYIIEIDEEENQDFHIKNFSLKVGAARFNEKAFVGFLTNKVKEFVFSQSEIKDIEGSADRAVYPKIQNKIGPKIGDSKEGVWGELILFILTEAVYEMPLISHKVSMKQSNKMEVFGSDGVFFGNIDGKECLGIGESKMKKDLKRAIYDSLKSTERFHKPEEEKKIEQELDFVSSNLSDDLNAEEQKHLAEKLTNPKESVRVVHPVFICYESDDFAAAEADSEFDEELREQIESIIKDEEFSQVVKEKIEQNFENIDSHLIMMMFLPVKNLEDFRDRIKYTIFPYLEDKEDE